MGPGQEVRNLRYLLYPCQDLHVSLETNSSGLPLVLLILILLSLPLPLTSPSPPVIAQTCRPYTSPSQLLFYLPPLYRQLPRLFILGAPPCGTGFVPYNDPNPQRLLPNTPYSSRSTPSGRIPVPSPRTCRPYVTTEVRSPIFGLSVSAVTHSESVGG